ncbi:hypothetical protein NL676_010228 [Syzygium grande]|nr:hypothetical protein NL676_010228 [Syzygium grande]
MPNGLRHVAVAGPLRKSFAQRRRGKSVVLVTSSSAVPTIVCSVKCLVFSLGFFSGGGGFLPSSLWPRTPSEFKLQIEFHVPFWNPFCRGYIL